MSEPAPKNPSPDRPQKQVSGFLVFSLILSLGGLFLRPLLGIGPLIGIVLGFVGRKKAKADPRLIGPRLALWCIVIGVATLGFQAFAIVRALPGQAWWRSVAESQYAFLEALRAGDYDRLLDLMDPDEAAYDDADALEKALAGLFPGEGKVDYAKVAVRQEGFDRESLEDRIQAFLSESGGELRFTLPVRIPVEKGPVDLDFDMRSRRLGYAEFQSYVRDVRVVPAAPAKPAPK